MFSVFFYAQVECNSPAGYSNCLFGVPVRSTNFDDTYNGFLPFLLLIYDILTTSSQLFYACTCGWKVSEKESYWNVCAVIGHFRVAICPICVKKSICAEPSILLIHNV